MQSARTTDQSLNPERVRSRAFTAGGVFLVWLVLMGIVWFVHTSKGVPIYKLTADPNAIANRPVYHGFLSQAGIFFWAAAAAACLLGARAARAGTPMRTFLLLAGTLTLALGLDDVFMLHENVFPDFGISEPAVYAVYGLTLLYVLARFRELILRTEYPLLAMGLFFFGLSVGVDMVHPYSFLIEDGAKLLGIVAWAVYFFRTAELAIRGRLPR